MNLNVRTLTIREIYNSVDYTIKWEPPIKTSHKALRPRLIGHAPWEDKKIIKTLYIPQLQKYLSGKSPYPELRYVTKEHIYEGEGVVDSNDAVSIIVDEQKLDLFAYDTVKWAGKQSFGDVSLRKATGIPHFSKNMKVYSGEISPSYVPHENIIYIPAKKYCHERYLECYFHECIHWTRDNIKLCKRNLPYAIEEVVACLGQLNLLMKTNTVVSEKQYKMMMNYLMSWLGTFDEALFKHAKRYAIEASENLLNMM